MRSPEAIQEFVVRESSRNQHCYLHVCGGAHGLHDAGELIRKHRPDVLLIESFLEDRDGIR